jgi:sortase A
MIDSARRVAALIFIALGCGCLGWYGYQVYSRTTFQKQQRAELAREVQSAPPTAAPPAAAAAPTASENPPPAPTGVIGQLEIPRVHLSVIVMEGDDDATLKKAVGHLPDTPMPWSDGNSAFAGHRDTFFRPLKDVHAGDEIRVTGTRGTQVYRVRETRIVDPSDISVLAPTPQPALTLVTCYPFYYVGNAPRRYIVQADRVESSPAPN